VESLEWVFEKSDGRLKEQLVHLAEASHFLGGDSLVTRDTLAEALQIPAEPLGVKHSALSDVRRCIPPVRDLERITSGLAFIRWLLQRVLPYPCFLLDDLQVAARLKVHAGQLDTVLSTENAFSSRMKKFAYSGLLSDFAGRRWWKAGVDEITWELTNEGSVARDQISARISAMSDTYVAQLDLTDPVVVVDEDLVATGEFRERDACVRLLPDDWPAYADLPYCALVEVLESAALQGIVHPDDQWRLEEARDAGAV
jgi:hypothetical protein